MAECSNFLSRAAAAENAQGTTLTDSDRLDTIIGLLTHIAGYSAVTARHGFSSINDALWDEDIGEHASSHMNRIATLVAESRNKEVPVNGDEASVGGITVVE